MPIFFNWKYAQHTKQNFHCIEGKIHPSKFYIGAFGHNDQPHEKRFCSTPVAHGVKKKLHEFCPHGLQLCTIAKVILQPFLLWLAILVLRYPIQKASNKRSYTPSLVYKGQGQIPSTQKPLFSWNSEYSWPLGWPLFF